MLPMVETHHEECLCHVFESLAFPSHVHAHMEIVCVRRGQLSIRIDGKTYIVHEGEIAVVFPGLLHEYVRTDAASEGFLIIFDPAVCREAALGTKLPICPVLRMDACHPDVAYCLQRLAEARERAAPRVQRAYLQLLTARAMERLELTDERCSAPADILHQAIVYLSAHYDEPLTLKDVSSQLCVSAYHLSHVFAQRLHMGFRAYLNSLRIAQAKQLLSDAGQTVTQVCFQCGFENLRTFDRVFAEQCGCSPSAYQKAAATGKTHGKEGESQIFPM